METRFTSQTHPAGPRCLKCAILNQKGGVGKTGLTVGTAGALAERGYRVLMVDLDAQGHLTTEALRLDEADPDGANLARALTGQFTGPTDDLIVKLPPHPSGGQLGIIPTSVAMFLVVRELYHSRAPEGRLARLLGQLVPGEWDFVLIDCPPSLDILTDNALAAADGLLIPVQPNNTSLRALRLLFDQLTVIEQELELAPRELYGMVPGIYRRPLSGIAKYKMAQLERYGAPDDPQVQPIPILAHLPLAAVVEEAWLSGKTVTDYKPDSPSSAAYRRVALRLEVAAGFAPQEEWDALPPVEAVVPELAADSTANAGA